MRAELADRQQLFDDHALRDHRFELVVDDIDRINLGALVAFDDGVRHLRDGIEIGPQEQVEVLARYLDLGGAMADAVIVGGEIVIVVLFRLLVDSGGDLLFIERDRLLADRLEVDILSLSDPLVDEPLRCLADVRVEAAGEALVAPR